MIVSRVFVRPLQHAHGCDRKARHGVDFVHSRGHIYCARCTARRCVVQPNVLVTWFVICLFFVLHSCIDLRPQLPYLSVLILRCCVYLVCCSRSQNGLYNDQSKQTACSVNIPPALTRRGEDFSKCCGRRLKTSALIRHRHPQHGSSSNTLRPW